MGDAECTAPLSVTAILCPEGAPCSGEAILAIICISEGFEAPEGGSDCAALHPCQSPQSSVPERSTPGLFEEFPRLLMPSEGRLPGHAGGRALLLRCSGC